MPGSIISILIDAFELIALYVLLILLIVSFHKGKSKLFLMGIAVLGIFIIIHTVRPFYNQSNEVSYLVNIKNKLYLGVNQNNDHVLISIDPGHIDTTSLNKKMKDYWQQKGIGTPRMVELEFPDSVDVSYGTVISIQDVQILLINTMKSGRVEMINQIDSNIDFVIVTKVYNDKLTKFLLLNVNSPVYGHNMYKSSLSELENYCREMQLDYKTIKYYDLIELVLPEKGGA